MIQITRPVAASRKWLRIRGGRIRFPPLRPCRMPPLESQIASNTNPPPAVAIHAISAAHSIPRLLGRGYRSGVRTVRANGFCPAGKRLTLPAVGDRRAAVAAEGLRRQANPGRRLPALVLGAVDQRERPLHDVRVEAVSRKLLA